jgi:DNA polymerase V
MAAMDQLNAKYGRNAVFPAATGIQRSWKQRAEHRSPRYTTRLSHLPVLRA